MSDTNFWVGTGRLTKDVELIDLKNDTKLAVGTVAVNRSYGTGDDRKEETLFLDFKVFGKRGEYFADKNQKGSKVLLEGRISQENWETDGQKRSKLVLVVNEFNLLTPKTDSENSKPASEQSKGYQNKPQGNRYNNKSSSSSKSNGFDERDKEIPF